MHRYLESSSSSSSSKQTSSMSNNSNSNSSNNNNSINNAMVAAPPMLSVDATSSSLSSNSIVDTYRGDQMTTTTNLSGSGGGGGASVSASLSRFDTFYTSVQRQIECFQKFKLSSAMDTREKSEQLAEMRRAYDALHKAYVDAQLSGEQARNQLAHANRFKEEAIQRISMLGEVVKALKAHVIALDERVAKYNESHALLVGDNKLKHERLNAAEKRWQERVEAAERDLIAYKQQHDSKLVALRSASEIQAADLAETERARDHARRALEACETLVGELRRQMAANDEQHTSAVSDLTARIASTQKLADEHSHRRDALAATLEESDASRRSLQRDLDELRKQLLDAQCRMEEMTNEKRAELSAASDDCTRQLADKDRIVEETSDRCATSERACQELQARLDQYVQQLADKDRIAEETSGRCATSERACQELQARLDQYVQQLADKDRIAEETSNRCATSERACQELQARLDQCNQQIGDKDRRMEEMIEEARVGATASADEFAKQLTVKDRQIEELEARNGEIVQSKQQLQSKVDELERLLVEKERHIEETNEQMRLQLSTNADDYVKQLRDKDRRMEEVSLESARCVDEARKQLDEEREKHERLVDEQKRKFDSEFRDLRTFMHEQSDNALDQLQHLLAEKHNYVLVLQQRLNETGERLDETLQLVEQLKAANASARADNAALVEHYEREERTWRSQIDNQKRRMNDEQAALKEELDAKERQLQTTVEKLEKLERSRSVSRDLNNNTNSVTTSDQRTANKRAANRSETDSERNELAKCSKLQNASSSTSVTISSLPVQHTAHADSSQPLTQVRLRREAAATANVTNAKPSSNQPNAPLSATLRSHVAAKTGTKLPLPLAGDEPSSQQSSSSTSSSSSSSSSSNESDSCETINVDESYLTQIEDMARASFKSYLKSSNKPTMTQPTLSASAVNNNNNNNKKQSQPSSTTAATTTTSSVVNPTGKRTLMMVPTSSNPTKASARSQQQQQQQPATSTPQTGDSQMSSLPMSGISSRSGKST